MAQVEFGRNFGLSTGHGHPVNALDVLPSSRSQVEWLGDDTLRTLVNVQRFQKRRIVTHMSPYNQTHVRV